VFGGEAVPLVERDRAFRGAEHDADVPPLVGVREQCPQQRRADPLVAEGGQHERVAEVAPGAGVATGLRHPVEHRQVHHADRLAGDLGQPADPAGGLPVVPVTEPRVEPRVVNRPEQLGGPRAAQGGEGGRVASARDADGGHGHDR